jgi:quercetin dioxygenase-like cupin family protein
VAVFGIVAEALLRRTKYGLVYDGEGWFVVNARETRWRDDGRPFGSYCDFEGKRRFGQIGISLYVLRPGEVMSLYHRERAQEGFLVLTGECLLIVEGEERSLRAWDFVHCPPEAKHVIVGAGESRCLLVAVGARDKSVGENWGGYTVDVTAAKHGASVDEETTKPAEAYAKVAKRAPTRTGKDWLPS